MRGTTHREYSKQKEKGYGRYFKSGGYGTTPGSFTSVTDTAGGAAGAAEDDGKQLLEKRTIPLRHPGKTVYNLPPLNHGPQSKFAPTPSAYANRILHGKVVQVDIRLTLG